MLTTRAHAVASLATSIDVEKMSFLEGKCLLLRRAQLLRLLSDDEVSAVEHLVVTLDHFPLALEQAGAYIEETGCTFAHYMHLYQSHRSVLLARRGVQSTNYPDSVATTWSLSFQNVQRANPAAAQLLQLCAFLAPDHIPEELLREGAAYWPTLLQEAVTDPFAFDQVLEALLRFSLVKRLAEDHLLSIHRLVQVVQMEMIAPQEQRQWVERMVRAVNGLFPRQPREDASSWSQCLRYLEQVQACSTLIEQHHVQLSEAADLLDRSGTYLYYQQGKYGLAERYYHQALEIQEEQLGAQHPETARTLNNLAGLYWTQHKYQQAEPLFARVLVIQEHTLTANHPDLARTLHGFARFHEGLGALQTAVALYQRALTIREQVYGPHHPKTSETRERLLTVLHLL